MCLVEEGGRTTEDRFFQNSCCTIRSAQKLLFERTFAPGADDLIQYDEDSLLYILLD